MAGSTTASSVTDVQREAFIKQFPAQIQPFVKNHMETPIGRTDIDAYIQADTKIVVLKAALAVPQSGGSSGATEGMCFVQEDRTLEIPPASRFAGLDPNKPKDQALFSYLLSNEAAHAIQSMDGTPDKLENISRKDPDAGLKYYTKIEMASDARSNTNLAERIKQGLISVEDVPDVVSRQGWKTVENPTVITSAIQADKSVSEIAQDATKSMWANKNDRRTKAYLEAGRDIVDEARKGPATAALASQAELDAIIDKSSSVNGFGKSIEATTNNLIPAKPVNTPSPESSATEIKGAFPGQPSSADNNATFKRLEGQSQSPPAIGPSVSIQQDAQYNIKPQQGM